MEQLLCDCLGVAPDELRKLMTLTPADLMQSEVAARARESTNLSMLRATLPEAQQLLKQSLPAFYDWLHDECGVVVIPASPDHAIEWVSDYLLGRQSIDDLLSHHANIPARVLDMAVPRFIGLFDGLQFGRDTWRLVMALLCLALLAGRSDVKGRA